MTARVLRYEVPVDDEWHDVGLSSHPLHVAARRPDVVEFWAVAHDQAPLVVRRFKVYGTGHDLPVGVGIRYIGTAVTAGGLLVWHLFEDESR